FTDALVWWRVRGGSDGRDRACGGDQTLEFLRWGHPLGTLPGRGGGSGGDSEAGGLAEGVTSRQVMGQRAAECVARTGGVDHVDRRGGTVIDGAFVGEVGAGGTHGHHYRSRTFYACDPQGVWRAGEVFQLGGVDHEDVDRLPQFRRQ